MTDFEQTLKDPRNLLGAIKTGVMVLVTGKFSTCQETSNKFPCMEFRCGAAINLSYTTHLEHSTL